MTMIAGASLGDFGLLAWDSRHEIPTEGGVRYEERSEVVHCSFRDGWAAGGGSLGVGLRTIAVLEGSEGGTLEELAERLAPELVIAAALASTDGYDASHSHATLLTAASGALECGDFKPAGGLRRFPVGSCFAIPPGVLTDPEEYDRLRDEFIGRVERELSRFGVLRAVAAFYDAVQAVTPALTGYVRVGILQQPQGALWQSLRLEGRASELAHASDAELLKRVRSEPTPPIGALT